MRDYERKKSNNLFSKTDKILRNKKAVGTVYVVLRLLVILVAIRQFFLGHYESTFLCILTLFLFLMPSILEKKLKIVLPSTLEIIILLFIFSAEILGEIHAFYAKIPGWDTMLHTLNGFLCAAIGFVLVDMLNRSERLSLKLSPIFMSIVAFCFSMTIGVLWEFFEFSLDYFLIFDTQKDWVVNHISTIMLDTTKTNTPVIIKDITDVLVKTADGGEYSLGVGGYLDIGLYDTMKDLIVNFVGAIVFSFIGYFYVKNQDKKEGKFAQRFIPTVNDK